MEGRRMNPIAETGRAPGCQQPSALHPQQPSARSSGFTLIELLVVIAIIVILATLAIAAGFKVRETNRQRVARTNGIRLAQAIEAYRDQQGFLPSASISTAAYDAWTDTNAQYGNFPVIRQVNGVMNREKFLELNAGELDTAGSFKDPWGQAFRVVVWKMDPNNSGRMLYSAEPAKFFQVYSTGPNRVWDQGAGDDVVPRH